MIEIGIYGMTLFNVMAAAYLIPRYFNRSTIYHASFLVGWTLHYVVGNILVLLSQNKIYTLASFSEFESSYLVGLLVGQYFLWTYIFLLDMTWKPFLGAERFRERARLSLVAILAVTSALAALFVFQIGLDAFFSTQLSQNRISIGEYAGEGIGTYYYLATFLISASILVGGFAIDRPKPSNVLLALISLLLVAIVFVPMGGRGRVVNVLIILALTSLLSRQEERLLRALNLRTILTVAVLVPLLVFWGLARDLQEGVEVATDRATLIYALAVDSTRLPNQAFIFDTYPAIGTYFGLHYIEALLGPFYELISSGSVGLIGDYSSLWYGATAGNYYQKSAVSPSFIGEIYMNFGVVGVLLSPMALLAVVSISRRIAGTDHPLATAVIIYYFQFNVFHGGLYSLFDLLVLVMPVLMALKFLIAPSGQSHSRYGRIAARQAALR